MRENGCRVRVGACSCRHSCQPARCCCVQTGLFYPLDLAWTRLAADTASLAEPRRYTSLLHCISQTYHYERLRGAASDLLQSWLIAWVRGLLPGW